MTGKLRKIHKSNFRQVKLSWACLQPAPNFRLFQFIWLGGGNSNIHAIKRTLMSMFLVLVSLFEVLGLHSSLSYISS